MLLYNSYDKHVYLQLFHILSCSGHILNDFTWTHCASGLFNTAWFIYMLLLIGLTHPPNKTKNMLNPVAHHCTLFPGNMCSTQKPLQNIVHRCKPERGPVGVDKTLYYQWFVDSLIQPIILQTLIHSGNNSFLFIFLFFCLVILLLVGHWIIHSTDSFLTDSFENKIAI